MSSPVNSRLPPGHIVIRAFLLVVVLGAFIGGAIVFVGSSAPARLIATAAGWWAAARDLVFPEP